MLYRKKENYSLRIKDNVVDIVAVTYFGVRHGLETLSQLMGYDDLHHRYIVNEHVSIVDSPEFAHRGVLVDTSRNFIPLDVIENVINGMSFNKVQQISFKHFSIQNGHCLAQRVPLAFD